MALVYADRVKETSTTTGTGAYDLAGAPSGFQSFVAGIGDTNTCCYAASDGTDWEIGIGTVGDAAPDTLTRTTIIASSNSDAAVDWGAGTKTIFVTPPAAALAGGASVFRANTANRLLFAETIWAAAAEVTLTDAATIAVDMSTFINAVVTLGGNRALGNPTNVKVGQYGYIRAVQDGTGGRTMSFGGYWKFVGGTPPTLTATASAWDMLFFVALTSTAIFVAPALDIS